MADEKKPKFIVGGVEVGPDGQPLAAPEAAPDPRDARIRELEEAAQVSAVNLTNAQAALTREQEAHKTTRDKLTAAREDLKAAQASLKKAGTAPAGASTAAPPAQATPPVQPSAPAEAKTDAKGS